MLDNKPVYILLKEVLDAQSGAIIPIGKRFTKYMDSNFYASKDGWRFSEEAIQKEDWFLKEQPKEVVEPIKVDDVWYHNHSAEEVIYKIRLNGKIPEEKYEAVKTAIEECLNGFKSNFGILFPKNISRNDDGTAKTVDPKYLNHVWMTQEKYNEEMENVWNEARLTHPLAGMKYDTFADYKASLPENKIPNTDTVKEGKGWGVVSWIKNHSVTNFNVGGANIDSVRRLSDGEVFTIGDKVGYDNGNTRTKEDWVIDNFFIRVSDGELLARSKDNINVEYVDKWLYKNRFVEKPPLGIIPEKLWLEQRLRDVYEAMKRYSAAGKSTPPEWSSEIYYLTEKLNK